MKKIINLVLALFLVCSQAANAEVKNMNNLINQDRLVNSFIRYAKIDTGSDPAMAEKKIPSTEKQFDLANLLAEELKKLGLQDVKVSEHCVVTAKLPANIDNAPIVALFAHVDTAHDVPTGVVKPQIVDYKGGDIKLANGKVILAEDLKDEIGHKVITTDGTTLLGADDKSGVAEIMEAITVLVENPSIKRPEIKVVFTPDEETGLGLSIFDTKNFEADLAYTVDGGAPFELDTSFFQLYHGLVRCSNN